MATLEHLASDGVFAWPVARHRRSEYLLALTAEEAIFGLAKPEAQM
jgi:hypothetical protein